MTASRFFRLLIPLALWAANPISAVASDPRLEPGILSEAPRGPIELPNDGAWSSLPGLPNEVTQAVLDTSRHRVIAYALESGSCWLLLLDGDPEWSLVGATGGPPPPRRQAAIALDPIRNRLMVDGGDDQYGRILTDTWAFSLDAGAWTQLTTVGSPGSRMYHTMTFDPIGDRFIAFGRFGSDGGNKAVYQLTLADPPTWSRQATSVPLANTEHVAAYDPIRNRVLFAGAPLGEAMEIWAYSLTGGPVWTNLTPASPGPSTRSLHTLVYDGAGDRIVLFGGFSYLYPWNDFDDAWTLNLSGDPQWMELSPSPLRPTARQGHSAAYDPSGRRMLIVGGQGGSGSPGGGVRERDTWALALDDPAEWSMVHGSPSARTGHTGIYDPVRHRMIVFGGIRGNPPVYLNDVWALSLGERPRWDPIEALGPPPGRTNHAAVYDPLRDRMVIFGGTHDLYDEAGVMNDVWALPLSGTPQWSLVTTEGTSPSPRENHSAVYDPVRDRMIVIGGKRLVWFGWCAGGNRYTPSYPNDTWALALSGTPAWSSLTSGIDEGHGSIYDPVADRLVTFGGERTHYECHGKYYERIPVWKDRSLELRLDGASTWADLAAGTGPSGRAEHSAIYDRARQRLVVYAGGRSAFYPEFDEVWALDLAGPPAWSLLSPAGTSPGASRGHAAIYDPVADAMWVFSPDNDGSTWKLRWESPTAVLIAPAGTRVMNDRVELAWTVSEAIGGARVERRRVPSAWELLGTATQDGEARIVFTDHDVRPGERYGYRLVIEHGSSELRSDETWVSVPPALELALRVHPNPSRRGLSVRFTLPQASPATVEVLDVVGRRIVGREVGSRGLGSHVLDLDEGLFPAGLYFVGLKQGPERVTAKAIVMP